MRTLSEDQPQSNFTPKKSRALKIWLGIVIAVLAMLALQTQTKYSTNYNLFLNGDKEFIGAQVFIDGIKRGELASVDSGGLKGSSLWTYVPNGKHTLEIRKDGFNSFHKEINMRGEDYIGVDLIPITKSDVQ